MSTHRVTITKEHISTWDYKVGDESWVTGNTGTTADFTVGTAPTLGNNSTVGFYSYSKDIDQSDCDCDQVQQNFAISSRFTSIKWTRGDKNGQYWYRSGREAIGDAFPALVRFRHHQGRQSDGYVTPTVSDNPWQDGWDSVVAADPYTIHSAGYYRSGFVTDDWGSTSGGVSNNIGYTDPIGTPQAGGLRGQDFAEGIWGGKKYGLYLHPNKQTGSHSSGCHTTALVAGNFINASNRRRHFGFLGGPWFNTSQPNRYCASYGYGFIPWDQFLGAAWWYSGLGYLIKAREI